MDGQTYVQSKMRPLKSNKRKNRKSNKNNRISTNKVSNIFHNKNFLIELWQLIFFSSTSIFLILTFLNQAWKPISFDQTKITGISGITKNDIKQITSIFLSGVEGPTLSADGLADVLIGASLSSR